MGQWALVTEPKWRRRNSLLLCLRPHSSAFSAPNSHYPADTERRHFKNIVLIKIMGFVRSALSANPFSCLNYWTSCPQMNITSNLSQLNKSSPALNPMTADEEGSGVLIFFRKIAVIMQSEFHATYCSTLAGWWQQGNMEYFCCHTWLNCKFILR